MEFMLDTIDLEEIKRYKDVIALAGVTSNPSIVKKAGKVDFAAHMQTIKEMIGEGSLHIQVVGETTEAIVNDAHLIGEKFGKEVYIKIPVNEPGLAAIKVLKADGYRITATAIYSEFQGYLAINAGADYIAPYYNRMENQNIDSEDIVKGLAAYIRENKSETKIVAASFKNVAQVNKAIRAGAHAVTVGADIFEQVLGMSSIQKAVTDFTNDWVTNFGTTDLF